MFCLIGIVEKWDNRAIIATTKRYQIGQGKIAYWGRYKRQCNLEAGYCGTRGKTFHCDLQNKHFIVDLKNISQRISRYLLNNVFCSYPFSWHKNIFHHAIHLFVIIKGHIQRSRWKTFSGKICSVCNNTNLSDSNSYSQYPCIYERILCCCTLAEDVL